MYRKIKLQDSLARRKWIAEGRLEEVKELYLLKKHARSSSERRTQAALVTVKDPEVGKSFINEPQEPFVNVASVHGSAEGVGAPSQECPSTTQSSSRGTLTHFCCLPFNPSQTSAQ